MFCNSVLKEVRKVKLKNFTTCVINDESNLRSFNSIAMRRLLLLLQRASSLATLNHFKQSTCCPDAAASHHFNLFDSFSISSVSGIDFSQSDD